MKRLALTLALLLSAMVSFSQVKDEDNHTLVSLWKTFYKAEQADRPQDELKALAAIKEEAVRKHLAWDFYDATQRSVSVRSSVNWKDRDAALKAQNEDVDAFPEPIVQFYHYYSAWTAERSNTFIEEHKDALLKANNPEFYAVDYRINSGWLFCPALLKLIQNDYEYALWSLCLGGCKSPINDYYSGRYPEEAFLEYKAVNFSWSKKDYDALTEYAAKYKGKAVALMGRQRCLEWEFRELNKDNKGTSAEYKELREKCKTFENERKQFTGKEKIVADSCTGVKELAEQLDAKDIQTSIHDNELTVTVRNIRSVKFQVLDGSKTVWETTLTNKTGSYYVMDTIKATIPDLNDGDYKVRCSAASCTDTKEWSKHSLSISLRPDSEGYRTYVADYITGKPVKTCILEMLNSDEKVVALEENVRMDGFTLLPESLRARIPKNGVFYVRARLIDEGGRLLSSRPAYVYDGRDYRYSYSSGDDARRAILLADRRAFNPGETVQFKAICYSGTYEYRPAPAGEKLKVTLLDPENKELATADLTTNEFGSASGSFPVTGGSRGGMYTLRLHWDGHQVSNLSIRVDEFVLPTFELTWDKDTRMYFSGDEIKVSGKIKAYSGHSLGTAVAHYSVSKINGKNDLGELKLGTDGRFSFSFKADDKSYSWSYPVTISVTDGTGETLSFSTTKHTNSSLPLSLSMQNDVPGKYSLTGGKKSRSSGWIVREGTADIRFSTAGLERESLKISYTITSDASGKQVVKGSAATGETVKVPIDKLPSGLYRIDAVATAFRDDGKEMETKVSDSFVKAADDDTSLDMNVSCFFKELGGEDIAMQIGSTDGPVWAVVELFGSGNVRLGQQIVTLSGVRGKAGSLKTVGFSRQADWPESLSMNVLWFRDGTSYSYTRRIMLPVMSIRLPLEFTRFTDTARPGQECSLLIKTVPGVECAATVFDKATETIAFNTWPTLSLSRKPEPQVYYTTVCGQNESHFYYSTREFSGGARVLSKSARSSGMMVEEAMVERASVDQELTDNAAPAPVEEMPAVRENFEATIAWEPHLRSDADGNMELKFKGGDRLSTYYVQLFAHGEGMHNATLRREMQVTIPVKLSLVEPQFLYEGDLYTAMSTVVSNKKTAVSGRMAIRFYDGRDWRTARVLATRTARIDLAAEGAGSLEAPFRVPAGVKELGVLVNFVSDEGTDGSDALFVTIPVKKPLQTLTEAHSALLRDPSGRDELIAGLRAMFVNIDGSKLEPKERNILEMIKEAIPQMVEPKGDDAMSLTEAWYANKLARKLGALGLDDAAFKEIADKIAACQNESGGIAWFEGMESSAVITAAVLQRVAALQDDALPINIEAAVKYLDNSYFSGSDRPWWFGGIGLEKYLHTRAMYPDVPFAVKGGKALRQFKKEAKAYLVPGAKRGLNAQILAKARRLRTLQLLYSSDEGIKLAKNWGICLKKRIRKSMDADIESLLQYAVEHRSGGYYYPNAVMPWRGLMESELYAHSLLCDLLTDFEKGKTVAEGLRLWIMVQKETQQWSDDAAYLEAIASVLRGTPETLAAKVILLSGTFTKPFPEVKKAGNGFTVSCEWSANGKILEPGTPLKVGDKVVALYSIWSEENRSFVRITAPRPASFRPVNQLSGYYGWWLAPLSYGGWSFTPQGYRNVLKDKTEYWFDSYPEENTSIKEEFFVTQQGEFQTPAIEIESLYAPHYRANDSGRGPVTSSPR